MLIVLIVISVLFIITWVIIGVSRDNVSSDCCHKYHDPVFADPFHRCEVTELRRKNENLQALNRRLENDLHRLEMEDRNWVTKPYSNGDLEKLIDQLKNPTELKITNATVTIKGK